MDVLGVSDSPYGRCGRKATLNERNHSFSRLYLMKVQVAKAHKLHALHWLAPHRFVLTAAVFLAAYCGSELVFLSFFVTL